MRITNLRHAFGEGSADDDDAALHRLHPLPSNITEESPDPPAGGGDLPFGLIGDPQTTTRPAPNTSLGKGLQGGAVGRVRGSSPNIKLRKAAMAFRWAGSARAKKGTVAARLAETLDAKIREPVW